MTAFCPRRFTLAALVALAGLSLAAPAPAASKSKTSDINAYSRRAPVTPARATERWVKIWYNETGWWIAWQASNVAPNREAGRRLMLLDIKGRIDRVGHGELSEAKAAGRIKAINKIESNKKAIYFEAPLGARPRTLQFKSTATKLKFSFIVDGRKNPSDILVGEKGESPKRMPFTLQTPEIPEDAGPRPRARRARPPRR